MENSYRWTENKDDSTSDKRIQTFSHQLPEVTIKITQHPLFGDSEELAYEFQNDKALRFYMDGSYLSVYSLESYRDIYVWKEGKGEQGDRRAIIAMAQNKRYVEKSTGLPKHIREGLLKAFLKLEELISYNGDLP